MKVEKKIYEEKKSNLEYLEKLVIWVIRLEGLYLEKS